MIEKYKVDEKSKKVTVYTSETQKLGQKIYRDGGIKLGPKFYALAGGVVFLRVMIEFLFRGYYWGNTGSSPF